MDDFSGIWLTIRVIGSITFGILFVMHVVFLFISRFRHQNDLSQAPIANVRFIVLLGTGVICALQFTFLAGNPATTIGHQVVNRMLFQIDFPIGVFIYMLLLFHWYALAFVTILIG